MNHPGESTVKGHNLQTARGSIPFWQSCSWDIRGGSQSACLGSPPFLSDGCLLLQELASGTGELAL